ncbi:MAG: hypothetical protein AMXMBFR83_15410 [Phycisphaerae bacterium]|jgi:cytochrome P450
MHVHAHDFLWLANHPDELQRLYAGQWLAVVEDRIVAAGRDGRAVYREARRNHPLAEITLEVVTEDAHDLLSMA